MPDKVLVFKENGTVVLEDRLVPLENAVAELGARVEKLESEGGGETEELVVEQQYDPGTYDKGANNIFCGGTPVQDIRKAMNFTPSVDHEIVAVDVRVAHGGNAHITMDCDLIVEVRNTDSSGAPGPNLLGSATISKDIIPKSWADGLAFCRAKFYVPVKVLAGAQYAIVCRADGGDGNNTHYIWNYSGSGTYDGRMWTTDYKGKWVRFPAGWNYYFKEFMQSA